MKKTPEGFMQVSSPELYLASQSSIRFKLLKDAGILIKTYNPGVDEREIKDQAQENNLSVKETVLLLACKKALSQQHDGYIISADQMMTCQGRWFDKPSSLKEAREHLMFLRGKTHILHTAAVIFKNGQQEAFFYDESHMKMHFFSDEFLTSYLEHEGQSCLSSVGCYKIEGYGIRLFESIKGEYTSILGLPLLPIILFLREKKIIKE